MRRAIVSLVLLAASAWMLAGCGLKGTLRPDLAPETSLFVTGPVDTVNHIVRLNWFGTDVDGEVVGYEIRFINPAAPAETAWVFTDRTDSTFTVFTPSGYTRPSFEVRAIDDKGQRDPTPARNDFQFSNQPPTVRITAGPAINDTTFASITVSWSAGDPDGDVARLRFLVWLDGNSANPVMTTARTFTVPTSSFLVNGSLTTGRRKLFVRAIDDGGRAGDPDSSSWIVQRPVAGAIARLLIIDDVPTTNAINLRIDTMFANSPGRAGVASDEFTILRLQTNQPFRSAADVEQTFKLFESVIWYRSNETSFPVVMRDYQAGIEAYVNAGGRFYTEGLYLTEGLNASGAFTPDFVNRVLDCDGQFAAWVSTTVFTDSSNGFGNRNNSRFRSDLLADSTRQQLLAVRPSEAGGLRAFKVRSNAQALLWALPLQLDPANPDSLPVAVVTQRPGGGRIIVNSAPFSTGTGSGNTGPRTIPKVIQLLLSPSPRPQF